MNMWIFEIQYLIPEGDDPEGYQSGIRGNILGLGAAFRLRSTASIYFSASPRRGDGNLLEVRQHFGYLHRLGSWQQKGAASYYSPIVCVACQVR
jgi:hypothetical protein